jgi:hypothetical protein
VLLGLGLLLAGESALADSTVPALPAATSLTTSTTYLAQGAATDTSLGFTTSVFDIAAGALTLKANGVTNAMLANQATTVNGTNCTLGSTCTPTAAASSITPGTTTIVGATAPCLIRNSATTVMDCLAIASGNSTALGVTTGSAGAPVLFNGAGGTPSSLTGTNISGTAASLTAGTATVANGLKSATTTVVVSAATAPTTGQVLTATAGTAADWETPSGGATGVGVQGGQSVSAVGDNATALPSGHYYYATNANMTAQRTHALPDSATQAVGDFMVMDTQQTVTATNQLCMARAGTDTINGGTTAVCITAAGGSMLFHNDGAGHFTTGPLANISAPTDAQILVGKTGTPSNIITPVTMSGSCTITNAGVISCPVTQSMSIGWIATVNPNNVVIGVLPANATVTSIVGAVETATGGAATVTINKATSGTACSGGTAVHSGSFDANGTAATNQTLTVTSGAITSAQRLCLQTSGTTSWTSGTGSGAITVNYTIP